MVLLGDLSQPTAPAPAGELARLEPDERVRVASASAEARARRRRAGPTPAQWRRFERWYAARATTALEAPPAEVARLPRRARRSGRSWPRSGARRPRSPPPARAAGRPDPTKTTIVADTLRGIARQHAQQPGAAPRQARALTYDQAREADARPPAIVAAAAAGSRSFDALHAKERGVLAQSEPSPGPDGPRSLLHAARSRRPRGSGSRRRTDAGRKARGQPRDGRSEATGENC